MAFSIGALVLGILLLYLGAEWMVKGSAGLARELGIPPLVIGLTVVAYGTSAPELVVSCIAAIEGKGSLALGNLIGSNISNIGLILGLTAIIAPIAVQGGLMRRDLPVMLLVSGAIPLVLLDNEVGRVEAAMLMTGAVLFTVVTVRSGRASEARARAAQAEADAEVGGAPAGGGRLRLTLIAVGGLGLLIGGGKVFVHGAVDLALALGMSPRTVGLTIVAVGTSLPELAASVIAAMRGHSELAVGNVIGSNIFNILLVLGGAGLARPIAAPLESLAVSLGALGLITLVAMMLMRKRRTITRTEGVLLLGLYAGFMGLLAAT